MRQAESILVEVASKAVMPASVRPPRAPRTRWRSPPSYLTVMGLVLVVLNKRAASLPRPQGVLASLKHDWKAGRAIKRIGRLEHDENGCNLLYRLRGGSQSGYYDDGSYYSGSRESPETEYYSALPEDYYGSPQQLGDSTDPYADNEYYYDDDGRRRPGDRPPPRTPSSYSRRGAAATPLPPRRPSSSMLLLLSSLPYKLQHGDRPLGLSLLSAGAIVTVLGISLFMNRTLLRFGNVLFLCGVPMTLGPHRTVTYFLDRHKWRATACLVAGICLTIVFNHPVLGILLELFGLLNLFGNMFPFVMAMLRQVPGLGPILNAGGATRRPPPERRRRQREYYDDRYGERVYDDDPDGDATSRDAVSRYY